MSTSRTSATPRHRARQARFRSPGSSSSPEATEGGIDKIPPSPIPPGSRPRRRRDGVNLFSAAQMLAAVRKSGPPGRGFQPARPRHQLARAVWAHIVVERGARLAKRALVAADERDAARLQPLPACLALAAHLKAQELFQHPVEI